MLLDEPTNHLDVKNVAWLEHYLTHLPDVTSMVVSHDSGFLDNVCTGIIHYENRKLKHYVVSIISVFSLLYSLLASCAFSFLTDLAFYLVHACLKRMVDSLCSRLFLEVTTWLNLG